MTLLLAARDLLLPARCAGCGAAGSWFCDRCVDECDPLTIRLAGGLAIRGVGAYGGGLREAIGRLKYAGERGLASELGSLVARLVVRLLPHAPIDAIVPVSLHPTRRRARGYDQALLLAEVVAARSGIPLAPTLARRVLGRPQVELGRDERARNVRDAFRAPAGGFRGLRVALVDDVTTTGATMAAAAAACRAAGARSIQGYVLAVDE